MFLNRAIFFLFSFFLFFGKLFPQSPDSLWDTFKNIKNHDTIRIAALYDLAWEVLYSNPDSSLTLGEMILNLSQSKGFKKWEGKAYNIKGASYQLKGVYLNAIDSYHHSLKILEQLKDKNGVAGANSNIGSLYIHLKEFKKALNYFLKSLKIFEETNNKAGIANVSNNLSIIYNSKSFRDNNKALDFAQQSLKYYKELDDKYGTASAIGNIAVIYIELAKFKESIDYNIECIQINEEIGNNEAISRAYSGIGKAYSSMGDKTKSIYFFHKSYLVANKEKDLKNILEASEYLYQAYKENKKSDSAFKYLHIFMTVRDSLTLMNSREELEKREMQFEFNKKLQADSIKNANEKEIQGALILAQNARIEQQTTVKWALIAGVCLLVVFGFIMYNRFRITRQQKEIIEQINNETEEQKAIIEEKQKEILASISYAKRLQEAILPSDNFIRDCLPSAFVFYKPKDIVAGDFYWLEKINHYTLFAAADCTGHGVPGAMVSIVCSNALNRTLKEFEIIDPGPMLDKVRELVAETFEKSHSEVKDGMDISLCLLNKNTMQLQWAGANNPLWLLRDNKIIEYKPNKQAIGKVDNPVPYTTHSISLQKNDTVYIFTDGFADQFGGPKGKKFMYKSLNDLFIEIGTLPINEQKEILNHKLNEWKGDLEQVDDVLIMGVKM